MRAGPLAVLTFLGVAVAVVLFAAVAAAGGGEIEGGGEPALQFMITEVVAPGDVVRSGVALPIFVRVVDLNFAPAEGMPVTASADGGTVTPESATTDRNGIAQFAYTVQVADVRKFTITFRVAMEGAYGDEATYEVVAIPPAPSRPILSRPETVSAGIGVAAILAALASTEFGKVGLFNVVVFPLYSRLRREEVLDHFVRGQIYGYITAHPGEHYNSLKDALKVTNGTLAHHLRTLEMQGFIKADRDGIYKRFYPVQMQIPRERGIRLSDLQHHILGLIRNDGGPTQQEIATRLGVSQQTVSYNLRSLSREGLVRMEKEGRAKRYFAADT